MTECKNEIRNLKSIVSNSSSSPELNRLARIRRFYPRIVSNVVRRLPVNNCSIVSLTSCRLIFRFTWFPTIGESVQLDSWGCWKSYRTHVGRRWCLDSLAVLESLGYSKAPTGAILDCSTQRLEQLVVAKEFHNSSAKQSSEQHVLGDEQICHADANGSDQREESRFEEYQIIRLRAIHSHE